MGWRYFAQTAPGGQVIDPDLPLSGVSITETLSGPGELSGTIPVEVARLRGANLWEWQAMVFAEKDGQIRGGGIVDVSRQTGPAWELNCVGHSGYPKGQPYVGDGWVGTAVDPADVYRLIWDHLQSFPDGDLGVVVSSDTTPVRIGSEQYVPLYETPSPADTTFDEGPIRLNFYETLDLGEMADEMAKAAPFDYRERIQYLSDGSVGLFIDIGYPRIGRRRDDLTFQLGVNVVEPPARTLVEEGYASEVIVLGAGEGREKVRGHAPRNRIGGLRRAVTLVDDTLRYDWQAQDRAREEQRQRSGIREIRQLALADHPMAPAGSFGVGDEIHVVGRSGWDEIDTWVRVVGITISPEDARTMQLEVRMP